ncbi:hypothetical protein HWC81_gp80 [Gordonia phage Crocheter]|uniref:Uncharacterized protein n=1 Tax=Gordonia phage Crocheter TaxID=2656532 RepID=A0A649VEA9_9CAUD|nr:hypothetical protein HWC81_gp80 [Gordonia phage Crocheter]QGJ90425.1 hypothetical protein PBI_CROCHETER_80 [Gordonia phage Crocheter]
MEYTLLVVDEKLGETIIEGYATQAGIVSAVENYTNLNDNGQLAFAATLGREGSAEHHGVWYSIFVTGTVKSMVKSFKHLESTSED